MIADILSPHVHRRSSWSEASLRGQPSVTTFAVEQGKPHADRALIVYQNVRRLSPEVSEVNELLLKARVVLPAIMNYLYFGSSQVAVVYFGKRVNKRGVKHGIREGAQDLKIRLIRYFTAEMWPPLLRTDAPDESLGYNINNDASKSALDSAEASMVLATGAPFPADVTRESAGGDCGQDAAARLAKEVAQERLWFRRSVENHMQVLLYLKNSTDGKSKYLKVVLQNTAHRLYFDVVEAREEKYRWDLRMLFTRMMDNLETQKAIDSYESYLEYFRQACTMAAKNALYLERPRQKMLEVVLWTRPKPAAVAASGQPSALQRADNCPSNHDGTPVVADSSGGDEATSFLTLSTIGSQHTDRPASREGDDSEDGVGEVVQPQVLSRRCSTTVAEWSTQDAATAAANGGGCGTAEAERPRRTPLLAPAIDAPIVVGSVTRSPTPAAATAVASSSRLSPATLGPRQSRASRRRSYPWMANLQKPESTTLDYKSYFFNTALEIRHRCVKFMCGFLNAYGEGKLVVGVHEIPRTAPANAEERKENGSNIVLHNDMVDQFVVGARVTGAELEELQVDVSEQLLCCIPPIPPRAVQVDAVPVKFPKGFAYAPQILILYDFANPNVSARDALKQKSNYAIRFLFTMGLSIVPLDLPTEEVRALLRASVAHPASPNVSDSPPAEARWDDVNTEAYLIAAVDNPMALHDSGWEEKLANSLNRHKQRCYHAILDYGPAMTRRLALPELFVLEVSVDIKRCGYGPLARYKGKFFAGWPSIPVWDPTTRSVRGVERNYNVLGATHPTTLVRPPVVSDTVNRSPRFAAAAMPGSDSAAPSTFQLDSSPGGRVSTYTASAVASPSSAMVTSGGAGPAGASAAALRTRGGGGGFQQQLVAEGLAWFAQPTVLSRVLAYLYNPARIHDILQFRLVHPLSNACFENRQGDYLVHMICSTPVGVPIFNAPPEQLSRIQYSFLHAGIPPLPLLLCHCYETIGNLPSPYPFVAVPLVQQTFRVAACLVPLFYRQHYFDGQLRLAVVLDLRDSLLKTVELRNGNLLLDTVVGVGFEPMNKRQFMRHFMRRGGGAPLPRRTGMSEPEPLDSPSSPLTTATATTTATLDEDDVLLKQSFVARRAFQPQALTHDTESHTASLVVSPKVGERCGGVAEREVEADIPLLHFRFLSRKAVEDGRYLHPEELPRQWIVSSGAAGPLSAASVDGRRWRGNRSADSGDASPRPASAEEAVSDSSAEVVDAAEMEAPAAHGRSWTLQHLLYWYNAFLTDRAHYSVFGCGNRSIAFSVASLSEVCAECVEPSAVGAVHAAALSNDPAASLAPSRDKCVLHRKVLDWLAV